MSRAAVVVNPTKLDDDEAFRKSVRRVMDDHGWDEPLWLETTPEDPGRGQAESAVSAGIGLVLACGGDGTVTACAEGITGTGVPLAIIPMGTGNLLAAISACRWAWKRRSRSRSAACSSRLTRAG
jgi:diacylglycerol kinase family enzyme